MPPTPPAPLQESFSAPAWQRLCALDAAFVARLGSQSAAQPRAGAASAGRPTDLAPTFDVAVVGGGLFSVLAPLLARRGLRVVVIERARAGEAHREWNASAQELEALVEAGLCSRAELDALIVNRYRAGSCAWHGGGAYTVTGVLDCAVDAQALLRLARARAEAAGVHFLDATQVIAEEGHDAGVRLWLAPAAAAMPHAAAKRRLDVRAMVDARGASSPYNRADLICPTVGGVLEGLATGKGRDRIDASVGEILATTEGIEGGRQHIWEAFPTRAGQTAVYLFYYARPATLPPHALARLYQRFCVTLPRFKAGAWRLLRPTYGLIPGWSRMGPGNKSPHRRIVLVGDAASRHSPLTFCGFGAMLRSLHAAVAATRAACQGAARVPPGADDQPLHKLTGALATMLAEPPANADPTVLNVLLDHAFATLEGMGNASFAALLQDRMASPDALRFLWRTSRRYPKVWRQVQQSLGVWRGAGWAMRAAMACLQAPRAAAP